MDLKREILKPAPIASAASLAVGLAIGAGVAGDTTTVNVYQPALTHHVADSVGVVAARREPSYVVLGNVDVGPGDTVSPGVNLTRGLVIVEPRLASPYDINAMSTEGGIPGQSFELSNVTCMEIDHDHGWCELAARNTSTETQRLVIRALVVEQPK